MDKKEHLENIQKHLGLDDENFNAVRQKVGDEFLIRLSKSKHLKEKYSVQIVDALKNSRN